MEGKAVAFSFSKKSAKKNLQPSALRGSVLSKDPNTTEIIESIEENVIKSNAPQQTELIIPLVEEDRASAIESLRKRAALKKQQTSVAAANDKTDTKHDQVLTLDQRAEQALLQEARDHENVSTQQDAGTIEGAGDTSKETGESSTLDDYDEMAVNSFGAAMLRGMGWNNDGVGRPKVRKVVSIVGAVNKTLSAVATRGPNNSTAPQEKGDDELLPLVKGAFVVVHQGRHTGIYGVVEEVELDHVLVRRALARSVGGEAVLREVPANVTVVTAAHYKQNSRIINKTMFDQAKAEEELKKKGKKRSSSESDNNTHMDTEDKSGPEQSRVSHTERMPDDRSPNSSESKKRIKEESSEMQNILDIQQRNEGSICTKDSKKDISTSKQIPNENSQKNRSEKYDKIAHATSIKNEKMPEPINETASSISSRNDTSRIERKHTSDHSKYKDNVRKDRKDWCDRLSSDQRHAKNEISGYFQSSSVKYSEHDSRYSSHRDSQVERHRYNELRSSHPESQHKGSHNKDNKEDYLSSKYGDASANVSADVKGHRQHCGVKERPSKAPWVREGLTVRIVSEHYKKGKYFKQKVRVMSVLTAASCECRTEEGKMLRDVPPSCLETVIPRQQPRLVLVLRGQLSGQLAVILEQHKANQEASVQLLDDRSVITRLSYEDICQYNR